MGQQNSKSRWRFSYLLKFVINTDVLLKEHLDFPDGPVVKTPSSQYREHRFNSLTGKFRMLPEMAKIL